MKELISLQAQNMVLQQSIVLLMSNGKGAAAEE
jgi:hypothetical protein